MKTGGSIKVSSNHSAAPEEKLRKTLHQLQPAATDKENLVGAGRRLRSALMSRDSIKNEMSDKLKIDLKKSIDKPKADSSKKSNDKLKSKNQAKDSKKDGRIFKDIGIQATPTNEPEITSKDLTSEEGPSEKYWEIVAERRRVALEEALEENHILTEQLKVYKDMYAEASALVEVLKEMIGEDDNNIDNSLDDSRL
ncbi:geminin [Trichogramma pretiosum]|uniref:geminin n=1 Tax=Trichogramma pretiosum TaxID=7493 RepID=UPI0006C99F75|nr:geminin [Trichogramma pretiosum]